MKTVSLLSKRVTPTRVPRVNSDINTKIVNTNYCSVNPPNRYTTGTSIGLSKGLHTNLQKWGNNQFINGTWQSR